MLRPIVPALLTLSILSFNLNAQQPLPTPASQRLESALKTRQSVARSLFDTLTADNIGPSIFSGRVTDLEADPGDPTHFYVAYASGGLWHTRNNGTTFEPLFDNEAAMTIGDIAIDWKQHLLWVGTGEANSSRSSYAGTGIYRSADGGKTWQHRGLPESHHIARIALHPTDPNRLWVAVLGHLYTPNPERGVYRSQDGGLTWEQTLFVNDSTGAIDLVVDPVDPNTLYAATWERARQAWSFKGAGEGSDVYKSTDGGQSWTRLNTPNSGFPDGPTVGRIGLCAGIQNGKTVLYACTDNQFPKPKKNKQETGITRQQLQSMKKETFLALDDQSLSDFLKKNEIPEKYSPAFLKEKIAASVFTPQTLVEYLEDANVRLFETDFTGAEVYRSEDSGKTWKKPHDFDLESMFFTYGYYFANIQCLPSQPDTAYLLGFFILRTFDGGKTWKNVNGQNVHVDHHALWIDPQHPNHLLNGNDGGVNMSYDAGESWIRCNQPAVGQSYAVAVDDANPYQVYTGNQDNGVWTGPSDYTPDPSWQMSGRYPYQEMLSGDGMQVAVDPRDNNTVYTGFQFGNYFRLDKKTGQTKSIKPQHQLGERPLRFNWQSPIHLSRHTPEVLYFGAEKLFRSFNRGDDWKAISPDLTLGGKTGNVPYGTLTAIHESPLVFGLLYTGSDDGRVSVSKDGGESWTDISAGLPARLWVSRVQASAHEKGRVYLALNGYRWDDFTPYLYVSENFGQTWTRLGAELPVEPVNVVREDPVNPNLLYLGTDRGLYASLDRGQSFFSLGRLPAVAVHDLALQTRQAELVAGTHGRSLYKIDVKALQLLGLENLGKPLVLFELPKKKVSASWGKKEPYETPKDPAVRILFYAAEAGPVKWKVSTADGLQLQSGAFHARKGLNRLDYSLDIRAEAVKGLRDAFKNKPNPPKLEAADTGKTYLPKGRYTIELDTASASAKQDLILE